MAFIIETEPDLVHANRRAFIEFGVYLHATHSKLRAVPILVVGDEDLLLDANHRASIAEHAAYAIEAPLHPDARRCDRFENELESGIRRCIEMRTDGNFTPVVCASDNLPVTYARTLAYVQQKCGRPSMRQLEPGRWYELQDRAVRYVAEGFGAQRTEMISVAPLRRSGLAGIVLEMIDQRNGRDAARQYARLTTLSLEHRR